MKQLILFLIAVSCLAACKKREAEIRDGYLAGRLIYSNPATPEIAAVPLGGREIKIALPSSDRLNFISSVTTDKDGYFVASYLDKNKAYLLFFADSVNQLLCTGESIDTTSKNNVLIIARPDTVSQNSLTITVTDASGEPVPSAAVCVFNNATAWQADTCTGSLYTEQLSQKGTGIRYNIAPGKYYFYCSAIIGGTYYRGKASAEVKASGNTPVTISLQTVPVIPSGLEITVTDAYNSPVSNAPVCVFSNYTQFLADTCLGSITQATTGALGKATVNTLTPGTYYFLCSATLGGVYHRGRATATVTATGVTPVAIQLLPVTPTAGTGFEITVNDQYNTPVNGANVCVFSNYTLFAADTCLGSILQLSTNAQGKLAQTIQPGTYYFRISLNTGAVYLKALDQLQVTSGSITKKTITVH